MSISFRAPHVVRRFLRGRQVVSRRTERMEENFRLSEMTENTGFLRQLYCVSRPANFGIIQPSNHNREPEKRTRHLPVRRTQTDQPLPDQAPADTSVPGQYSGPAWPAGRCSGFPTGQDVAISV